MALTPTPTPASPAPLTEDAFLSDRHKFWTSFTGATTGAVVVMVVLLVGMAVFLL